MTNSDKSNSDIVAKAAALGGKLRELSADAQKARKIPDAAIAAFVESGLNRLMQPTAHGGANAGPEASVAAVLDLAKGDAGLGWALAAYIDNAHAAAAFGADAQAEVWGGAANALIAGGLVPNGKAEAKGGGYVVSGTWAAVPGVDQADWFLGVSTVEGGEAPRRIGFLIKKSEARILEWKGVGLEGAGVRTVVLDKVQVPAGRVLEQSPLLNRKSSLTLAAVAVGTAASMLEAFAALCANTALRGRRTADNYATALRLSESKADLDAVELSLKAAAADTMAELKSGEGLSVERRALNSAKAAHAAVVSARAADRIFAAAGAKAILAVNPVQRFMLDVHAIVSQDVFAWDNAGADYGLIRIGDTPG